MPDPFDVEGVGAVDVPQELDDQSALQGVLDLNEGTVYTALLRLQQRGWISAEWGTSDHNRKAKYYSITRSGRKQLVEDAAHWQRLTRVMGRVLSMPAEGDL